MFPLVHHFVNSQILKNTSHLTALGSLFPDLATGIGYDRNQAHMMGHDFYLWCQKHRPQSLDLARGIISHGIDPHGLDYYADEYWPNYHKGWCFMLGENYMAQVAAATRLPEDLIWWKAHNFVEMGCELLTNQQYPLLKEQLLTAINDEDAKRTASDILSAYTGKRSDDIRRIYDKVPQIFAIEQINPLSLAQKQSEAFIIRHHINNADVEEMAALLIRISREIKQEYHSFLADIIPKISLVLECY